MRILFITHQPYLHRNNGGTQRSAVLFDSLQQHAAVDTWWVADVASLAPVEREAVCQRFHVVRFGLGLYPPLSMPAGRIRRWTRALRQAAPEPRVGEALHQLMAAHSYDFVMCRYLATFLRTGAYRTRRALVDIDDHPADVLRTRRMALAQSDLPINQRWHRWCALALRSALELRSFRRYLPHAPACFIAKDEDVQRVPNRNVFVLPNIPLVQHSIEAQCTREEHALLVVASWGWYPNHAGLTAFLRRAWATVRTAVPDARLYIVGSGLSEETKGEWAAVRGVVVVGTVDKLNEWYSRTAFSLAPIELGGGTSIKVLESLAYSRTLVTTRHGARGYEKCLLDGEALLVADD
jgi:glycosyltransferase involved in cell wall biosynthesis